MYKNLLKTLMMPLQYLENPLVNGVLKIFLVFYAGAVAPKLPSVVANLFKNSIVKMIVLFLITYTGIKDPVISLMIAVAFTLTMLSLNKLETVGDVHDLLDAVIDVPQELLNDLVDGAQELVGDVADNVDSLTGNIGLEIAGPSVDVLNSVVDNVQELSNNVIDMSQEVVSDIVGTVLPKKVEEEQKEDFSMEKPNQDDFEMGTLGDIHGSDVLDNVAEL